MRSFTMPLKVLRTIPKGVFTFTRIQDNNCSQHIKNVVLAIKTTSQQISDLRFSDFISRIFSSADEYKDQY